MAGWELTCRIQTVSTTRQIGFLIPGITQLHVRRFLFREDAVKVRSERVETGRVIPCIIQVGEPWDVKYLCTDLRCPLFVMQTNKSCRTYHTRQCLSRPYRQQEKNENMAGDDFDLLRDPGQINHLVSFSWQSHILKISFSSQKRWRLKSRSSGWDVISFMISSCSCV